MAKIVGKIELKSVELRLAEMRDADLESVLELERYCFSSPWSLKSFQLAVSDSSCFTRMVWDAEQLVAYLIAFSIEDEFLIANLAVRESHRRLGIASRILKEALKEGRRRKATYAVLDVRESNDSAIQLYRKFGFRVFSRRPDYYYSPREDALVMGRLLQD